jgi:hypothetical protein
MDVVHDLIEVSREFDIYLACFCPDEAQCHRRLAAEFMNKLREGICP